jgi:anti-anti-sigma regulatory factor
VLLRKREVQFSSLAGGAAEEHCAPVYEGRMRPANGRIDQQKFGGYMDFQFEHQRSCLIIRMSGTTGANERLLSREKLIRNIDDSSRGVIVDMSGLKEEQNPSVLGIINTIKKECQFLGISVSFCSLKPRLYCYFQELRLGTIFDICHTMDQAKAS